MAHESDHSVCFGAWRPSPLESSLIVLSRRRLLLLLSPPSPTPPCCPRSPSPSPSSSFSSSPTSSSSPSSASPAREHLRPDRRHSSLCSRRRSRRQRSRNPTSAALAALPHACTTSESACK